VCRSLIASLVVALTTGVAAAVVAAAPPGGKSAPVALPPPAANVLIINLTPCPPSAAGHATLSGSGSSGALTQCSAVISFTDIDAIILNGGAQDDTLTIDLASGTPIPASGVTFAGGGGNNALILTGTGAQAGSYTPSSSTYGSGTLVVGGGTVAFSGLQPVSVSGMASFVLTLPGPNNQLAVDSPGAGQNRVSGTTNGVAFEALTFSTITSFTLDAATSGAPANPGDVVAISAQGLVATGLQNLTINTGPNADSLTVATPSYALPLAGGAFTFNGGAGANTFQGTDAGAAAVTYTLTGGSVASSAGGGSIALSGVTQVDVSGGSGSDTFNATPSATAALAINGTAPDPPTSPGDVLAVTTAGTTTPVLSAVLSGTGYAGSWTFADRQSVTFQRIETTSAPVTVDTSPSGLAFTVDAVPYTSPQTFSWVVGSQHTVAVGSPQAGAPGTRYVFASWSDAGAITHAATVAPANAALTASFTTQYQLTTAAVPPACGVTPASGGYHDGGAVVAIEALPCTEFAFRRWSGPVAVAAAASTTVTMSQPQSVTAEYAEIIPLLGPASLAALAVLIAAAAALALGRTRGGC